MRRSSLWVKLLSKSAWLLAVLAGALLTASNGCGPTPAPKYGAPYDAGTDGG